MTLKQHIHELVDKLPDDSPSLVQVLGMLQLNQMLQEATADVEAGRIYTAEDFAAQVQKRWPR